MDAMDDTAPPQGISLAAPSDDKAAEWTTVLCAAGYEYCLTHGNEGWVFYLPADVAKAARAELEGYEADNHNWPPVARPEPDAVPQLPISWSPAWVSGLLIVFYGWLGPFEAANPFLRAAALDAEAVRAGEWWRVITALLVHADSGHLLGNVCCLLLLGRTACLTFGSGLAWTLILVTGAVGNAVEAYYFPSLRLSVGASTAGFGALGLLVGTRAVQKARDWNEAGPAIRAFALPTIAGLALLALLGTGPRSNLAAHALGMLSGALLGGILGLGRAPTLPPWVHRTLELLALTTLMLAWRAAFASTAR